MKENFIFTKDIEFYQLMAINFMAYAGVHLSKVSKFSDVDDDFKVLIIDARDLKDKDKELLNDLSQFKGKKFIFYCLLGIIIFTA